MQVATPEQLAQFYDRCDDRDLSRAVFVLVHTGLRTGELLGLRWSDIDSDHAQRARNEYEPSGFKEPKTRSSRRSIALTAEALAVLREHRNAQLERRLQLDSAWDDGDLVFPRSAGTPESVRNLSTRWKARRSLGGMEHLRLHDMRHTSATLALKAGVHPKIVQERLDHANIGVTLDTYSHVLPNMQREAYFLSYQRVPFGQRASCQTTVFRGPG